MKKKKIIYLYISGGIDSLACLIILKILKYNFECIHILNLIYFKKKILEIIYKISKIINIKIIIINLKIFYKKKIFLKFLKNYNNKKVINPDISCNKIIKFKFLLKNIIKKKTKIITGHYAISVKNKILISKDKNKNQTYFLYKINKNKSNNIIFLIGKILKITIKKIIFYLQKKINLNYKSSKGICFFENKSLKYFLFFYILKKIKNILLFKKKIKNYLNLNFKKEKEFYSKILILKKFFIKKIKKNFLKCKINNSKNFLNCKIKKILKKNIILKIDKYKKISKGQDVTIHYKKENVGGGVVV